MRSERTQFMLAQKPRLMFGLTMRLRIARRDTLVYRYMLPLRKDTSAVPANRLTRMKSQASEVRRAVCCVYMKQMMSVVGGSMRPNTYSPTRTGRAPVHRVRVHEHTTRVDPRAHVCMCVHRRGLYVTHVCVACLLACGACLPHRRCDPIAGQGRRSRQSQVVEVLRVEI